MLRTCLIYYIDLTWMIGKEKGMANLMVIVANSTLWRYNKDF